MKKYLLGLALAAPPSVAAATQSVAILGDAFATGMAARSEVNFDFQDIWAILTGARAASGSGGASGERPVHLWPSPREFRGGWQWVTDHLLEGWARLYLDAETQSWGLHVARSLGATSNQVYFAAHDRARIAELPAQVDRLVRATNGKIPEKILIFFSANDICQPDPALMTSAKDYGKALATALGDIQHLQSATQRTEVYVLGHLSLLQLVTQSAILQKPVHAFERDTTCKELASRNFLPASTDALRGVPPEGIYVSQYVPPNPHHLCPTVFGLNRLGEGQLGLFASREHDARVAGVAKKVDAMMTTVAGRIRNIRDEAQEVVRKYRDLGLAVRYIAAPDHFSLEPDDVANDCFHLSESGHERLAARISAEINSLQN